MSADSTMTNSANTTDATNATDATTTAPGLLPHTRHNTEATSIAMRFFARAIGDRNPRHVNESYRSETDAPGFMAHPCWLYSVQDTVIAAGHPERQTIIARTNWQWHRPVVRGMKIHTVARLLEEWRSTSRHAGEAIAQRVAVHYEDERGTPLARAVSTLLRVLPEDAVRQGKHRDWQRWRYTDEQLSKIEAGYDAERVRGALPRYCEDVAAGEALAGIVRGPISSEEIVLFMGATRPIPSMTAFARTLRDNPAHGFIHTRNDAWEDYQAGLVDDESARLLGFPAAHDSGLERIAQAASLVTNWTGDTGRLVRLDARLVEPAMHGDTTWYSGHVTGVDAGQGAVSLMIEGINQRGVVNLTAAAEVVLPRRAA